MTRPPVTAGIDGSAASLARAARAASEAEMHETELHLVAAWHRPSGVSRPGIPDVVPGEHGARRSLRLTAGRLHSRHPDR
ncbi:hypothetical protein ACFWXK_21845 [Streptomyces sp. NPDC059070]|uniref:hypothetical protein n=1 Tax=Streptomyces sp. NPDC059070 TaxID=3346713 RepID=UPI0036BA6129